MEGQAWFYIPPDPELSHRINRWRQQVEACTNLSTPSSQNLFPCDILPPSVPTRLRNSRQQKPYARPPVAPQYQMDASNFQPVTFLDTRQVRAVPELARENREMSGHLLSVDLPHPEHNALIACQPDVLKEEYRRLAVLFRKLSAERATAELQWLQTRSRDVMARLMDLGSNMQCVRDAAQYIVNYSKKHGWNIDFEASVNEAPAPSARVLPSRVRELVCSPGISNGQNPNAQWHLYPAA